MEKGKSHVEKKLEQNLKKIQELTKESKTKRTESKGYHLGTIVLKYTDQS